jgi:hypothetical protein
MSIAPQRCLETRLEIGQCQLTYPHQDKPHAAASAAGVALWNHLEVHRWPSYELPNWVRRLPWAADCGPAQQESY